MAFDPSKRLPQQPVRGQAIAKAHTFKKGQGGAMPPRMSTLVTNALREKLASADTETKTSCAQRLADILYRCATNPDPEVDKTRIMAIDQIIDRCEGKPKQQVDVNDITAELRGRSDQDLLYHMEHGHWPEEKVQ